MSSLDGGERDESELTDEERRWLALDRYLAGDASANDVLLAREWCGDRSAVEVIEALRRIRETLGRPVAASDVDSAWARLRVQLLIEQAPPRPTTRMADASHRPIMLLPSDDTSQETTSSSNGDTADDDEDR